MLVMLKTIVLIRFENFELIGLTNEHIEEIMTDSGVCRRVNFCVLRTLQIVFLLAVEFLHFP